MNDRLEEALSQFEKINFRFKGGKEYEKTKQ